MDSKKFIIPPVKLPTKEEIDKISKRWFSVHEGIHMLEWNNNLKSVSMPFEAVKLPPDWAEDTVNRKDRCDDFIKLVGPALKKLGCEDSFFIKLITRSPKDYLDENFELKSLEDAYTALACSMRTAEDLCMLINIDMCYVIVRPFVKINRLEEFRVLIYGKQIVGISQYYFHEGEKIQNHAAREAGIRSFIHKEIMPNVAINHFVVDVYFDQWNDPVLIELNPFGMSDPCLFMDYASLDGTFKYNQ